MLNGKNWQTLVVGVAAYGRERERLEELEYMSSKEQDVVVRQRIGAAATKIVRDLLSLPEDTPVEQVYVAWAGLKEAFKAQEQLAHTVAYLEALCTAYGEGEEED